MPDDVVPVTTNKQSFIIYTDPVFGPGEIFFTGILTLPGLPLELTLLMQSSGVSNLLSYEILLDIPE